MSYPAAVLPLRVLYVAGSNYSGSTLLAFLANAHPEMTSIGEMGPARTGHHDYTCSCASPISDCDFFGRVGAQMRALGHDFDPRDMGLRLAYGTNAVMNRLVHGNLSSRLLNAVRDRVVSRLPAYESIVRDLLERNVAFKRAATTVAGTSVFVDTNKRPRRIAFLAASSDIDLRVVHLVRDPRAQGHSALRHTGFSPERVGRAWRRRQREIERLVGAHVSKHLVHVLRYEDLAGQPEREMARLALFAGLEAAPLPDDFRSGSHHIIGNAMRKRSAATIRVDERWRKELAASDRAAVERLTERTALRYGYSFH